ncbi:phage head closure protein [Limosilactobacillus fermentum]|uniref:phage head closure protein n=1 Tax=Limosilactobacillus fermentum TaxID=1613 RepID=UPI00124AEDD0|nr:phage head closure protein [Limosilactobacillus fermentum]KAB1962492.1 phage head closure protein [Limosilactobacillus fermentum]
MATSRTVPYSYQPYQMRYTAEFGSFNTVDNDMGIPMPTFVSQFKLHYARVSQTISQKYEALGTDFENTQILAVRHDKRMTDKLAVRIDGKVYSIVDLSAHDDTYLSYDLITIKRYKAGGQDG